MRRPISPARGGSSPRVRGTRCSRPATMYRARFIPACAGNTRFGAGRRARELVHPRVCGEHIGIVVLVALGAGSSPRVRGTRGSGYSRRIENRFIPACAGNTPGPSVPAGAASVHPRVCGEHFYGEIASKR